MVGETARSMSYQYYGYDKPTNAHTQDQGLIVFKDTSSCGTAAVSLPCMFSRMGREDYDSRRAYAQDTAVDVLNHGGIKVQWFDNDSGCKGVCDQVENISIDLNSDPGVVYWPILFSTKVLLNKLDETLATAERKDTVIVLHVIGSHGPTYFLRYPPEHRKFTPDCQRSDIQNCSPDELMNTTTTPFLYTDYIISEVVKSYKISKINLIQPCCISATTANL